MSWILAFVGFALLIILHEFGHFVAAKAVGMRVERFSLFFPPLVARYRRGDSETEYAVGAVPLGGYVKITGMNPEEDIPPEVAHRAYYRQKVWKRIVVIAAGPAVNIVLAFLLFWGIFATATFPEVVPRVAEVQEGTPAEGTLRPGDELVAVDGRRGDVAELREQLATHTCAGEPRPGCRAETPARLTVRRDGELRTIELRPVYDAQERRPLAGFLFGSRPVEFGVGEAADRSVSFMWEVTTLTVDRITRLFYDAEARRDVSGVVGSYKVTQEVIELDDWVRVMQVLALISLSLGVINLFPFLPLDGGHIFWAAAEKVRGRAISFRVMERAGVVGFLLVIFLFLVGLNNDVGRLTSGEGFGVR